MIDKDLFLEAHGLVLDWKGKENQNVPAEVISHIFSVHNRIFPHMPEYSKGCGGCRERVWRRLKDWHEENKHLYGY